MPNVEPVFNDYPDDITYLVELDRQDTEAFKKRDNYNYDRKRSCANCVHAKVKGVDPMPLTYCEMGHGKVMELAEMFKGSGQGFRKSMDCPDREFFDHIKTERGETP